tara:strand:- start:285 stop:482 length:198 start_codon:yes stop_codon:yes gene_type:complete
MIRFQKSTFYATYCTDLADLPLLINELALPPYTPLSPMALAQDKATSGTVGGPLFPAVHGAVEML